MQRFFVINETVTTVMLNPESVILNLIQNLFRAGLVQHLTEPGSYETLKRVQGDRINCETVSQGQRQGSISIKRRVL